MSKVKAPEAGTTAAREAAYERFKAEHLSGAKFARLSFPDPIARYHGGPLSHRTYGAMMEAVARFAGQSDWHAAAARHVFGKVNLYATVTEALAQVAGGISEFVGRGYTDVIRMTGPEPGRASQYTDQPLTESQHIELALLYVEVQTSVTASGGSLGYVAGIGWALERWMREFPGRVYADGSLVIPHYFPLTKAKVAKR